MATEQDLARQLLDRAHDDHAAVGAVLDIGQVTDAIVALLAQQAVEKSLKAVLAASGVEFPFSHDIRLLVRLCSEAGTEVPAELSGAERLSAFAARHRYGASGQGGIDRKTAARWSAVAVEWADRLVGRSARAQSE